MRPNHNLTCLHWPGIICISAQGSGPSSMLIKFMIKTAQPAKVFKKMGVFWRPVLPDPLGFKSEYNQTIDCPVMIV